MGSDLSRNQRITCVFNLLIKFSMLIFLFSLQSIFFNVLTAHELHTDQTKTEFAGCVIINRVLPNSAIRDEMICLSAVDFAVGNYSSTKLPSESENVRLCHCWLVHFQWLVIHFCITPCIMHQRQQHTFRHWLRTLHIFHHNVSGMEIWSQWHQWLWTDTKKSTKAREDEEKRNASRCGSHLNAEHIKEVSEMLWASTQSISNTRRISYLLSNLPHKILPYLFRLIYIVWSVGICLVSSRTLFASR